MDLTTVADDEVVLHDAGRPLTHRGLAPDTAYEFDGVAARTLPRPPGERLATFCTVNDVHFGEVECGHLDGHHGGPIYSTPPGEEPYPLVMNRAAVADMAAVGPAGPDLVVVKGDLTAEGTKDEYQQFLDTYEPAFGDRLLHVRGNHDAYHGEDFASQAPLLRSLPGVTLAVIDTTIPRSATGAVSADTLAWLDQVGAEADRPVLVFGHHHPWAPGSVERSPEYFGINPDDSEQLVAVMARHDHLRGYFAGHTHRNRVRRFRQSGVVPWVEVSCVKDYPGAWAEYRVYEGGVVQVFRRISSPDALAWSERTRGMYSGTYHDYAFGAVEDRNFAIEW